MDEEKTQGNAKSENQVNNTGGGQGLEHASRSIGSGENKGAQVIEVANQFEEVRIEAVEAREGDFTEAYNEGVAIEAPRETPALRAFLKSKPKDNKERRTRIQLQGQDGLFPEKINSTESISLKNQQVEKSVTKAAKSHVFKSPIRKELPSFKTISTQIGSMSKDVCNLYNDLTSVESLVKELGSWRVFKEIIFQDYHFKLLPLVQIEIERKKRMQKKSKVDRKPQNSKLSLKEDFQNGNDKDGLAKKLSSYVSDAMDMNSAMSRLKMRVCEKLNLMTVDLENFRRDNSESDQSSNHTQSEEDPELTRLRKQFASMSLNGTMQDKIDYFFIHNLPQVLQDPNCLLVEKEQF